MASISLLLTVALPVLVALLHVQDVRGYIPAQPSNRTVQANASMLRLQWYTNGSDLEYVTRQPVGSELSNNGPVQGILVHFSENNAGNEFTTTPWIAFVSCDANSTNSSSETDVFTMAKDRGAKSVILYSLYSETCAINSGFKNSVLDVFTAPTLNTSWHIEYEFSKFGPLNEAHYVYNATMLSDAAGVMNNTILSGYPAAPGFIFATLPIYDNNAGLGMQADFNGTGPTTISTGSQNTGVAMIVLYVITGCVSALFCAVIVSGAIRAIRYPERYGPRSADPTRGGGQSRAGGLGRAILDTFPIVKFRPSENEQEPGLSRHKDVESMPLDTDFTSPVPPPTSVQREQPSPQDGHHEPREGTEDRPTEGSGQTGLPQTSTTEHGGSRVPAPTREIDGRMPECIGRETCPICIVDFEEGDDLRVLPCEGKHRFHQSCVDPWLLELSASCPICRQDFRALETIISGEPAGEAGQANRNSDAGTPTTQNRFSRYLRFARRRQQSREQESLPPPES